jgi:hypothetical protein
MVIVPTADRRSIAIAFSISWQQQQLSLSRPIIVPTLRTSRKRNETVDARDGVAVPTSNRVRVDLILLEHFVAPIARKEHHVDISVSTNQGEQV